MDTIHDALGIEHLLRSADTMAPTWEISHPDTGTLQSVADFERATVTGDVLDRDDVLIALARLASAAGENCPEAAALLCHLLIPGTLAKLRHHRPTHLMPSDIYRAAAQHLWIGARTFPWETRRKVAATIQWQVRRATFTDLGITARDRGDRVWSLTQPATDEVLDRHPAELTPQLHVEPEWEVDAALWDALRARVISQEEVDLLRELLAAAGDLPPGRVGVHGLLSRAICAEVANRLGIAPSTVRRRVAKALEHLQDARRAGTIQALAA